MKTILKNIMLFAAGTLALGFASCEEEGQDLNFRILPGDELYLPANDAFANLDQGLNINFEWAPSVAEDGGYVTYDVLFDKEDGDFSNPLAIKSSDMTGSKSSLSITAKDLNDIAASAGIENAKTGKIKWTVRVGKGLNATMYAQVNTLNVTRIALVDPLPAGITLKGSALENPDGIEMLTPSLLNGAAPSTGTFWVFTRIGSGEFTVSDVPEGGEPRYYELKSSGKIKYVAETTEPVVNKLPEGVVWLSLDFSAMTWKSVKINKMELQQSSSDNIDGNNRPDASITEYKMFYEMDYAGNGVWEILNHSNVMSTTKKEGQVVAGDSRHKFRMTTDGGEYYWGTEASLGASYTTDYLKCNLWSGANVGNADWDKSWSFLTTDCGVPFDGYLYLNADNAAGTFYHSYDFKR